MAHKLWCGQPCADCKNPCDLDEHIPCSPDCENLNHDGTRNIAACKEAKCDAYEEDGAEYKNYDVTVVRTGYVAVRAKSEADALWLADHITTDTVNWSDDWSPTDAEENPDLDDDECVTEPMFL